MSELRDLIESGNAYDFFLAFGWCANLLSKEDQALAEKEWPRMIALLDTAEKARSVSKMAFYNPNVNKEAEERLEELSSFNPQEVTTPEAAKKLANLFLYNGKAFQKICLHWVALCDGPREIVELYEYLSHMEKDNNSSVVEVVREAVSRKMKLFNLTIFMPFYRSGFFVALFLLIGYNALNNNFYSYLK